MKLVIEFKGRPITYEQIALLNAIAAQAKAGEVSARLVIEANAAGITMRQPPSTKD